jgi:N-acetylmuramoyl-L-alanine amidase
MTYVLALLASLVAWHGLTEGGAPAAPGGGVAIPLETVDAARGDLVLPRVSAARGADPPLVVVDAGHGGRDPGASSPHGGQVEKNVTLALARRVRDALAASGRVRVALTREDDTYLLLQDRYEIARRLEADLFVSTPRPTMTAPAAPPSTLCRRSPRTATRPSSPSARTRPT